MAVSKDVKHYLDNLKTSSEGVWVVLYEGSTLRMSSGKQSWRTSGAARNAFANEFVYHAENYGYKNASEMRKQLEHEGVIEIKQL